MKWDWDEAWYYLRLTKNYLVVFGIIMAIFAISAVMATRMNKAVLVRVDTLIEKVEKVIESREKVLKMGEGW